MVLFWIDLWQIFFLPTAAFWTGDLWISSPALYHCTMPTLGFYLWEYQVINSGADGLMVVLFWLDLWEIFFLPILGFELGTYGCLVLHSNTAQQWFCFSHLSISGISLWCRGIDGGNVLIWPVRDFFFTHNRVWTGDLWISSPALYNCTAVILFFTFENIR